MKKGYKFLATVSLSLLTAGLFAQSSANMQIKAKMGGHRMKAHTLAHNSHKATGTTTYAFMDYPFSDSSAASIYYSGSTYFGSPLIGQFYIQQMNAHTTMSDTGAHGSNGQPTNVLLIHNASVAFDTILDATTGNGWAASNVNNVVVDSLFIPIGQGNASGQNDTLVVSINTVDANGVPTKTVLWSQSIIQDTGLSGKGKTWLTGLDELALNPNLTLTGTTKFAVVLNYYDETKLDTCGFLWGAPAYNCAALGGNIPDTTLIGTRIPITGGTHVVANSFTTGYNYFTGAKPSNSNPTLTLPNTTYGAAFYYPCTPDTTIGLDWQDIAIFAEVSFTDVTGVKNITSNGLSVSQNFPNPFNQQTQISYSVNKASDIVFTVYDMTGRELVNNTYSNVTPGQHTVTLGANAFTPGIYFYTFTVNGNKVTKKMVITE